ncbi:CXXC1 [Mytilus coruscus]|uniref:CXXC1 n=1 Tax=Mytilus coruscus TaxID=42192 RepID=A0A6J8E9P9_MYTCO|nr:CXXC1 [Mytilus coruscus]
MILVADGNVIVSPETGEMSIQVVQDEYGVGLGKYAVDEICESQGKDPELKWLVKGLKGEGDPPQGEIFRSSPHAKFYWVNRSRFTMTDRGEVILIPTKAENPRLVVPMEWRNEILELCHDIPSAGHQGAERTREKIKQSYYWHGLGADVERYVASFKHCSQNKKATRDGSPPDLDGYMAELVEAMQAAHEVARQNIKTSQLRSKRDYDPGNEWVEKDTLDNPEQTPKQTRDDNPPTPDLLQDSGVGKAEEGSEIIRPTHNIEGTQSGVDDFEPGLASSQEELYCICRGPDIQDFMVGCDGCTEWFHGRCVGISPQEAEELGEYLCQTCKEAK